MSAVPNALLALETSGNLGSVAVAVGGEVRARRFLAEPRAHASAIVGAIDAVLMAAGITRQALGGVVVGSGPGSFTGVRVAAATGKGLAHALGCPMWAASSLAAGALTPEALPPGAGPWAAPAPGDLPSRRGVLFDARGRRLFAAAFEVSGVRSKVILDPRFLTLDELLGALELDCDFLGCEFEDRLFHRSALLPHSAAILLELYLVA